MVKHLPTMRDTGVQSLGQEDPPEKEMATHSSTLAWKIPWMEESGRWGKIPWMEESGRWGKIPWMEESGRLQPMGSQRVRHDLATSL